MYQDACYTVTRLGEDESEDNQRDLVLPFPVGVKEAFLKVAQGVISLFQHNQLKATSVEPSFSPLNSSTVVPSQVQSNGHNSSVAVNTPVSTKPTVEEKGFFRRCCES